MIMEYPIEKLMELFDRAETDPIISVQLQKATTKKQMEALFAAANLPIPKPKDTQEFLKHKKMLLDKVRY